MDHPRPLPSVESAFKAYLEARRGDRPVEREEFLASQAPALREELRRLIEDSELLLESVGAEPVGLVAGRIIGSFRLTRELGRGGMGSVWEAEDPSLKRKVALKVLKPELSFSPSFLRRFQREAEAGGRLQHSGIVQTYGVREQGGLHWIVQELVPGGFSLADSLARFREQRVLPEDYYSGVAELFLKVAEALHYAHENGVIHRDIKPGNLLLTESDEPKVADFGLAKVQDELGLTRTGDFLGTPYYMSPEQAVSKQMGLDRRSDIFSLGATLYEALTLVRAFNGDTTQQVFQKILTEDPPDPRKIRSRIPRDLVLISMKCLEKSPDRRYGTMAELAADLRRHLSSEPIHARPTSTIRRLVKWCNRHPVLATSAAASTLALSIISWAFTEVVAERNLRALEAENARLKAKTTDRTVQFLTGMFDQEDPEVSRGRAITVREVLDRARASLAQELEEEPLVSATLCASLGVVYYKIGLFEDAEGLLRTALDLKSQHLPKEDPSYLSSEDDLGNLLLAQGRPEEAEALFRHCLTVRREVLESESRETLSTLANLATSLLHQGRGIEAKPLAEECLEKRMALFGPEDRDTMQALSLAAEMSLELGDFKTAENQFLRCLELRKQEYGLDSPKTVVIFNNLAQLFQGQGRYEEAVELLLPCLTHLQGLEPEKRGHWNLLVPIRNLAEVYRLLGRYEEAQQSIDVGLSTIQDWDISPSLTVVPDLLESQALLYFHQRKVDQGIRYMKEALEVRSEFHADDLDRVWGCHLQWGDIELKRGDLLAALAEYEKALEVGRAAFPARAPQLLGSLERLARIHLSLGDSTRALPYAEELLAGTEAGDPAFPGRGALLREIRAASR